MGAVTVFVCVCVCVWPRLFFDYLIFRLKFHNKMKKVKNWEDALVCLYNMKPRSMLFFLYCSFIIEKWIPQKKKEMKELKKKSKTLATQNQKCEGENTDMSKQIGK